VRPCVSFDLDGVLIQNPFKLGVGPHVRALVRGGPALWDVEPGEADRRIDTAVAAAVAERMRRGELVAAYDWDTIFGEVARGFGVPELPDIAGLVRHYCQEEGMIWLLDGAGAALERLACAGYRLVATTNGYARFQQPVLEALGIARHFESLLTPDSTGFAKPDPRILAGVKGVTAHVGDMLYHDVLLARRAGVTAVWCTHHLPPDLAEVAAPERTADPRFERFLARVRDRQPYGDAHPEASEAELRPHHVVREVGEVTPELVAAAVAQ
jgi:putative hydrolase of the HAD superfamily